MPDSPAPEWFEKAVAQPAESRFVDVKGTSIHYLIWNAQDTHKPGLLFAHGLRAHARWWSFIAPFFLSRFRVAALDFAGMGDSGNRQQYEITDFSQDILAVLKDAGFGRATLVGHSFGGGRVMRTTAEFPESVERAVIIDSHIGVPEAGRRSHPPVDVRPKKIYAEYEAARARFRLVPEHNCAAPYVLDYVGRHSLTQVAGGWTWKFDELMQPRRVDENPEWAGKTLESIAVPVTFIYGDLSIVVTREHAHAIVKHLRHGHGPIAIPQAHHHVMLDQPLSLVSALRAVLY
jgi:pimeloyl-ACP methyl ester carboxylesterase